MWYCVRGEGGTVLKLITPSSGGADSMFQVAGVYVHVPLRSECLHGRLFCGHDIEYIANTYACILFLVNNNILSTK